MQPYSYIVNKNMTAFSPRKLAEREIFVVWFMPGPCSSFKFVLLFSEGANLQLLRANCIRTWERKLHAVSRKKTISLFSLLWVCFLRHSFCSPIFLLYTVPIFPPNEKKWKMTQIIKTFNVSKHNRYSHKIKYLWSFKSYCISHFMGDSIVSCS